MKRIIFVCPAVSTPVGGVKVLVRHSEILNRISAPDLQSFIYVPDNLQQTFDWLEHNALYKRDHLIDPATDLVLLPEGMAARLGPRLTALGIRYAIFVQNGYRLFSHSTPRCSKLADVYANAVRVLSISRDTTHCIEAAFPDLHGHVIPMRYSVDPHLFHPHDRKRDAIAYMPRKLADHAQAVIGFLRAADLGSWDIVPIDGLSETQVAAVLRRTRIFLSFSHLEGCPVPPLEAALSGNHVVGYTGEGGKEYWDCPLFTEVASGNIRQFVARTLETVRTLTDKRLNPITNARHVSARRHLAEMFSPEVETDAVSTFLEAAAQLFAGATSSDPAANLFSRREIQRSRLERRRQQLEWLATAAVKTALSPLKWPP